MNFFTVARTKLRTRIWGAFAFVIAVFGVGMAHLINSFAELGNITDAIGNLKGAAISTQYMAHDDNAYLLGHLEHKTGFAEHSGELRKFWSSFRAYERLHGNGSVDERSLAGRVEKDISGYIAGSRQLFAAHDVSRARKQEFVQTATELLGDFTARTNTLPLETRTAMFGIAAEIFEASLSVTMLAAQDKERADDIAMRLERLDSRLSGLPQVSPEIKERVQAFTDLARQLLDAQSEVDKNWQAADEFADRLDGAIGQLTALLRAEIESFKGESSREFYLILAFVLIATLLMALRINRAISKPVDGLVRAAEAITAGDLTRRVGDMKSEELGRLGGAFNDMADRIQKFSEELEARVLERTFQLEKSERRANAILDTATEGIITIDKRGIIKTVNPSTERIFGYTSQEMIGENVKMLTPEPHRRAHDGYLANYLETGERKIIGTPRELDGERKDGTTFPIELTVVELKAVGEHMFMGNVRDITERREVERQKDEFVASVSHELRTPLTVILGYLPLLTEPDKMPAPEMVARISGKMEESGNHLLTIVNDLLDITKMESGNLELERTLLPAASLVSSVVQQLRREAESKGLTIETHADQCTVYADDTRLRQILINLIGNAIKFTESGRIHVSVTGDGETTSFEVLDTGSGIPEDQHEIIFARFKQVDGSSTRESGGTGLGLAISKNLVEMHGGEISISSVRPKGARFTFTIPQTAEQAARHG